MTQTRCLGTIRRLALFVMSTASCQSGSHQPARVVIDSAGVELVTLAAPDSTTPAWKVQLNTPIAVVGGMADSSGQLSRLEAATVLPDGRIYVSTDDVSRIHAFDSVGRTVGRFGRAGDGPGEFHLEPTLFRHGDSLVTVDDRRGQIRIGIWDGNSNMVRACTGRIPVRYDDMHGPIGVADDGSVILMTELQVKTDPAGRDVEGAYRSRVTISRLNASGGDAVRVLDLPGQERYGLNGSGGIRNTYLQFGKATYATVSGGQIDATTNDDNEITSWTAQGKLVRRLRIRLPSQRVTKDVREKYAREELEGAPPDNRRLTELALSVARYADYLRPFDALYSTQEGGLWIEESRLSDRDPRRYVIVDAEGRMVGVTALPPRLKPVWISKDRVLLKGHDASDAPFVGLYSVRH